MCWYFAMSTLFHVGRLVAKHKAMSTFRLVLFSLIPSRARRLSSSVFDPVRSSNSRHFLVSWTVVRVVLRICVTVYIIQFMIVWISEQRDRYVVDDWSFYSLDVICLFMNYLWIRSKSHTEGLIRDGFQEKALWKSCHSQKWRGDPYIESVHCREEGFPLCRDFAPLGPRDCPRSSLLGLGVQYPCSREISGFSGVVFPSSQDSTVNRYII